MEAKVDRYLFRGMKAGGSEWVYGYLWRRFFTYIKEVETDEITNAPSGKDYLVDIRTVGQCTGISADKSYRGTDPGDLLIFEGDLFRDCFSDEYGIVRYGVYKHSDASSDYQNGGCGFYVDWSHSKKCEYHRQDLNYWAQYEIAGNIHEHRHLFEVQQDEEE